MTLRQPWFLGASARVAGTRLTRPEGGYFVWVDMPWDTVDALALRVSALAEQISFAPGPMFSNHGGFRNCLRLNFGHPWTPRTEEAIATLGRLVSQQSAPSADRESRRE